MARIEIPLGDIAFSQIHFQQDALADALQHFVTQGSQRGQIGIEDLNIIRRTGEENVPFTTVAEAIQNGTRLFDALAYFTIPIAQRPVVTVVPLNAGERDPDVLTISKAVFFVFMWVLVRGGAPSSDQQQNTAPVPKFLDQVMGLTDPPHVYVNRIASFDLSKMHHGWVKFIRVNGVGIETQNRLALGIAGYRLPAALAVVPLRDGIDENLLTAVNAVKSFLHRGLTWDCFGHTRTPLFLQRVKNFNKNIGNLLLEVATRDNLQALVDRKILFAMPEEDLRFTEYQSWTDETFRDFVDYIFPH